MSAPAPDLFTVAGVAAPVGEHAQQPIKRTRCKFCKATIPPEDEGSIAWRICETCWPDTCFESDL